MKKILFVAPLLAALFVACDPTTEDGGSGFNENVTASNVEATATPVVVNGKNTNLIVVENKSKINCQWRAGQLIEDSTISAKTYDTIYVTKTGTNAINFIGVNSVSRFTKAIDVSVDNIYYLTSTLQKRLCVSGSAGNYVSTDDGSTKMELGNSFDINKVKVTQSVTEDGKLGNVLKVRNYNGVLSNWTFDKTSSDKNNFDLLYVTKPGTYDLTLTYTMANGTSKTITVGTYTVEALTYVPEELELLGGTSGKSWKWFKESADGVWGNGGFMESTAPSWWKVQYADIDGQAASKGTIANDGSGVVGTFNMNKLTYTKNNGASGSFVYDLTDHAKEGWDKGSITFKGVNIPMGYLVNNGNAIPEKYYVVKLTSKYLTLCAPEPGAGDGGTAWFWCFVVDTTE
jgi:hypothetical protein